MTTVEINELADAPPLDTALPPLDWLISDTPVDYLRAVAFMEERAQAIRDGRAAEAVWLVEHPPLYTAGTSADIAELVDPDRFPVYETGRGGRYTYHGPGQRVAYVMMDLKLRGQDIRRYIDDLEEWVIRSLATFNVRAERREGRVGLWVSQGAPANPAYREDKIAAIGVRVRRWVSFHGIALNIDPDLGHFDGIIPCGIAEHGVTSLWDLGHTVSMPEVDGVLKSNFAEVFGRQLHENRIPGPSFS